MADFGALRAQAPLAPTDLYGLTVRITHEDPPGHSTLKWITLDRTRGHPPHAFAAYCWHEGKARAFRFADVTKVRDGADETMDLGGFLAMFGIQAYSRSRSLVPVRGAFQPLSLVRPSGPGAAGQKETSRFLEVLGLFWIDMVAALAATGFYYDFKAMLAIVLLLTIAVAPVGLLVGMVRPRWVLPRRAAPTRLSVVGLYVTALILALFLIGVVFSDTEGKIDPNSGLAGSATEQPAPSTGERKLRDP